MNDPQAPALTPAQLDGARNLAVAIRSAGTANELRRCETSWGFMTVQVQVDADDPARIRVHAVPMVKLPLTTANGNPLVMPVEMPMCGQRVRLNLRTDDLDEAAADLLLRVTRHIEQFRAALAAVQLAA